MVTGKFFLVPGRFIMVPGRFQSELSAWGGKWDIENIPQGCIGLIYILAPRSRPLGLAGFCLVMMMMVMVMMIEKKWWRSGSHRRHCCSIFGSSAFSFAPINCQMRTRGFLLSFLSDFPLFCSLFFILVRALQVCKRFPGLFPLAPPPIHAIGNPYIMFPGLLRKSPLFSLKIRTCASSVSQHWVSNHAR